MNIEYERTIDDLIDFNLFHFSKSPSLQRQILFSRIAVSFLVFILSVSGIYIILRKADLVSIVLGIMGSLFLFAIYPYVTRRSLVRRIRKMLSEGDNKAVIGHQVISLSPEGISNETQAGESTVNWSSITKVMQDDQYVFLYISSVNAFVIPKKAFSTDTSLREFLDYVNTHSEQKTVGA